MGKDRFKRGKKSLPPFLRVERELFGAPVFAVLSHSAVRVYLCFRNVENGHNKNDLRVSYDYIKKHGVGSYKTIAKAIKELEQAGLIDVVKHGGLYKQSNVYGLSERWKQQTSTTVSVASRYATCSEEHPKKPSTATASVAVGAKY